MQKEQLERELTLTKVIVGAIYGSVIIYAVLIYLGALPLMYSEPQISLPIFLALLGSVPFIFLISIIIGKAFMSSQSLTKVFYEAEDTEKGMMAAIKNIRIGAFIMAALGEACGIYGLVVYMLSDEIITPWIFLGLSVVHCPITLSRLNRAQEDIQRLARNI